MKLHVEYIPIDSIKPYENNAKIHTPEQIEQIKTSIKEFGMNDPIGIWSNDNIIVEGHGRLLAMQELNFKEVPVIRLDDLTDDQRKAYTLIHNQTTMNTGFDIDILQMELENIDFDMSSFDFDIDDINLGPEDTEIKEDDFDGEKEAKEIDNPTIKKGEVWKLGKHFLMCGDSTSKEDLKKLMNGNRVDICFTSPPYNVFSKFDGNADDIRGYLSNQESTYNSYSDDLSDEDYSKMLSDALKNALSVSDDVFFNIGCVSGALKGTAMFLGDNAKYFAGVIAWEKNNAIPTAFKSQYGLLKNKFEPIYTFNERGTRKYAHPQWEINNQLDNTVSTEGAQGNKFSNHSATFPVSFPSHFIKYFTNESVLDLFGGTGTTMIAAEELNRTCYMMELDPVYCDVIVKRFEEFTGEKATLYKGVK